MKSESTIRKQLSVLKKQKEVSDTFLENIKHNKINKAVISWKGQNQNLKGHIDAIKWVLGE